MALSLTGAKVIAMILQMATLIFFCMLPIKIGYFVFNRGEKGKRFLSCCRCFGGGALLGSFMLHMTPEIRYLLNKALLVPRNISYPIPELIAAIGFFAFLLLEWFVTLLDNIAEEKLEKKQLQKQLSASSGDLGQIKMWLEYNNFCLDPIGESTDDTDSIANQNSCNNKGSFAVESPPDSKRTSRSSGQMDTGSKVSTVQTAPGVVVMRNSLSPAQKTLRRSRRPSYHSGRLSKISGEGADSTAEIHSYHSGRLSVRASTVYSSTERSASTIHVAGRRKKERPSPAPTSERSSVLSNPEAGTRTLILLIALSADGFFQGMALGLQRTIAAVFSLLIAIIAHEFVVAFCLGLELVQSKPLKSVLINSIIYGFTPVLGCSTGIGISMAQGDQAPGQTPSMASGILQSFAAGVFLYVAFVGILAEELTSHPTIVAIVSVISGFGLIAVLSIFHVHDHPIDYSDATTPLYPNI